MTTTPTQTIMATMAIIPPQVRVGVGIIVLESAEESENPRFLIGKRINTRGAGTWALPSGHLEFGESPEECAAREMMEETGLEVSNVQFLTYTNDYMPEDGRHFISLLMVCTRSNDGDEPQTLEDKCEGWEWVSWVDLMTWVKRELEAGDDEVLERRIFLPLLHLVQQRPDMPPPALKKKL